MVTEKTFPVFVWVVFIFLVLLMQWIQLTDNNSPSNGYVSQIRPKDVFYKLNKNKLGMKIWNDKSVIQWFYIVNILLIAFFFSFTPLGALEKKTQLANYCHILYMQIKVYI